MQYKKNWFVLKNTDFRRERCRSGCLFQCAQTKAKHNVNVKVDKKDIYTQTTKKNTPPPTKNQPPSQTKTRTSNHKLSDEQLWSVSIKWWRK